MFIVLEELVVPSKFDINYRTTGTAYTLFTMENHKQARDLVKIMDEAKQIVDPKLRDIAHTSSGGARRPYGQSRGGYGGRGGYNTRFGGNDRYRPYK